MFSITFLMCLTVWDQKLYQSTLINIVKLSLHLPSTHQEIRATRGMICSCTVLYSTEDIVNAADVR